MTKLPWRNIDLRFALLLAVREQSDVVQLRAAKNLAVDEHS